MPEYHMTPYYTQCWRCCREYHIYLTDDKQAYGVLFAHGWITDGDKCLCPDCIGGE